MNEQEQTTEVQSLEASGKPEYLEKTLLEQVWTGNQMNIQCWDWKSYRVPWSTAPKSYLFLKCLLG